ncbi:MAG: hypothetical protein WDW36_002940 [Sanguina aurantia]
MFAAVYAQWPNATLGPPPVWLPTQQHLSESNVTAFVQAYKGLPGWSCLQAAGLTPVQGWAVLHSMSITDPERFWPALLTHLAIHFDVPSTRVLRMDSGKQPSPDRCRWFPGARLNIAHCALHSQRAVPCCPAMVWAEQDSPSVLHAMSIEQLRASVAQTAGSVLQLFKPGDALAMVLPMTVEAVVLYLAVIHCGCVVVSIADSFSAEEIALRLRISRAVAVFTQDVVIRGGRVLPLYARVVAAAAKADSAHPLSIIVLPATRSSQHSHTQPTTCLQNTATYPTHSTANAAAAASASGLPPASTSMPRQPATPDPPQHSAASHPSSAVPLRAGDLAWGAFLALGSSRGCERQPPSAHITDAYSPTNIMFSSGTTGEPKALAWTHLTPLRAAMDAWAHHDLHPGQVLCLPTNMGWMMGPWVIYAALLNGATLALYEGSPLGREFGVFVEAAGVDALGVIPSIVKAWRHSDCMQGLDWSSLRCLSSTGEASSPEDYHWLSARAGYKPIMEYIGGTELGGAFLSSTTLHPCVPSAFATPTLGACPVLLPSGDHARTTLLRPVGHLPDGEAGAHDGRGADASSPGAARLYGVGGGGGDGPCVGELALVPPMIGGSQALLNRDHYGVYYGGMPRVSGLPLRRHGDEMERLPGGYLRALGRTDNTMNLGGIKVSSVELERTIVELVPGVLEAAAVGVPEPGGGPERLFVFLVMKPGSGCSSGSGDNERWAGLREACQAAVRKRMNPLFKVETVLVRASLPRNAANKVMHRTLRDELPKGSRL